MPVLITVLTIIFVLWLLGLWFRHGENLRVFDHPVAPEVGERFGKNAKPSAEHSQVVAEVEALGGQQKGLSRNEKLQFVRDFMEAMPDGKSFSCEFVPVDAGGVPAEWVLAPGVDVSRRVLYIHGGAFIAGSPNSHRTITSRLSEVADAAVLAIDYRLMPENRRMEGIEDCQTAYRWILENGPADSGALSRLYMGGDSAGGNLSLVMSAWVRDEKLRAPDAVIAFSPLTDSTYSSPSIQHNLATDTMLGPLFGFLNKIPVSVLAWMFLLVNRIRPSNPIVSPVYGSLSHLPPTLVQVSESEMLLDDARRYVNKARAAGSPAFVQSWSNLLHVWQVFYPEVPEACEAWDQVGEFLQRVEAGNV
jgi:monoterpene epsilon-lactone hydrolase